MPKNMFAGSYPELVLWKDEKICPVSLEAALDLEKGITGLEERIENFPLFKQTGLLVFTEHFVVGKDKDDGEWNVSFRKLCPKDCTRCSKNDQLLRHQIAQILCAHGLLL